MCNNQNIKINILAGGVMIKINFKKIFLFTVLLFVFVGCDLKKAEEAYEKGDYVNAVKYSAKYLDGKKSFPNNKESKQILENLDTIVKYYEKNIAAAAKYIRELHSHFNDIPNPLERSYFVLASYNGGFFHVRDAMALTRKFGKNPYRWADVQEFVLKLRVPAYYNDPVVKHGYMRGDETVDYVARICNRWGQYRGFAHSFGGGFSGGFSGGFGNITPSRAKHRNRFKI